MYFSLPAYSNFFKKIITLGQTNPCMICCCLLAAIFLFFPENSIAIASTITEKAVAQFGLIFIIISSVMTLLCFAIAISPWGSIKLGSEDSTPEFSFFSWTAMLFAAGMGSGLVFWGVAEPVSHFSNPPAFAAGAHAQKDMALTLTYFHWGIHAWSIYAIAGLAMAWFAFNKKRPLNISSSFTHKNKVGGYQILNYMAIIAVVFGVAGTLANSIALIQSGLIKTISEDLAGTGTRLIILIIIAAAFIASSMSGLHRGIKNLSQFNLILVLALLTTVLLMVEPSLVFHRIITSTWRYLQELPSLSFSIDPNSHQWSENWSIIYLIWWIAWAPFVGPFIGRISQGRTIRQFLLCAILIPTAASIIWFSTFAGSLFEMPALSGITNAVSQDFTQGLFSFFELLPMGSVLSIAALLLLATFVITSADSAVYIAGMLTGQTGLYARFGWSLILVAITTALLYQNNVKLNNQIAIIGAIPFAFVLCGQAFMLIKSLISYKTAPSVHSSVPHATSS